MIACVLPLLVSCADFDTSAPPSILNSRLDGPGLPRYLDKHQSTVRISGSKSELMGAFRDALAILGFSEMRQDNDAFRADRRFIMGFVCGIGGETLYLEADKIKEGEYSVSAVSYKRFPYPSSTRFLDGDFVDLLVQLLEHSHADEAS